MRGAYSETLFRGVIDKYLPALTRPATSLAQPARDQQGADPWPDLVATEQCSVTEYRRHLDLAKVLVLRGDPVAAAELPDESPERAMHDPEFSLLHTHLNLLRAAESAPHREALESALRARPGDHAVRYQLSVLLLEDGYEPAMQHLHRLLTAADAPLRRRARRGMLAIMALLSATASAQPEIPGRADHAELLTMNAPLSCDHTPLYC